VRLVEIELLSALRRALEFDDAAAAGVLLVALAPKWLSELTQDVHLDLVRRTVRLLESSRADDEVLALVHGWLALLLAERAAGPNSLDEVDAERLRALELARHLDPMVRLRVLALAVRTGRAYVDRGPLVECCDEAMQLASEQGAEDFLARFEIWGGMLAHQNGDLDRACSLAKAARQRGLHLDDASLIVTATAFLRTLPETTTRDLDLPSASQIVASARACDEQRVLLWMLPSASVGALADGDLRTATEYDVELLERARDAGAGIWTALPAITQSEVAVHHGDLLGAARLHGFARNHMYGLEAMLPPARLVRFGATCDEVRTSLGAAAYDEAAAGGSLLSPGEATIEVLAAARRHLARIEPSEVAGRDGQAGGDEQQSLLTARELDVVELLVAGDSNKDIARRLGITPKTVMHHTSSIYRKLGVRGRAETVAWAVRQTA
jgi:DNA-binding CsgD family transcriptional regulator